MVRKISEDTIKFIIKVYKTLKDRDEISTLQLFDFMAQMDDEVEYYHVYRALRILLRKGIVEKIKEGRSVGWKIKKDLNEEEIEFILSH